MNLPLEALLPYASFALAVAGLAVRIFVPASTRKVSLLLIVLICLVVMTGVGSYRAYVYSKRVEVVSREILAVLGTETKTLDEIQETLFKVDLDLATEALDSLVVGGWVGHRIMDVRDDFGTSHRVRGYYVGVGEERGQP